ncbi:Fe-only nitrogenase subunit delta [Brenneria roseae subsp. americana]|uniref:Nitrogenase iron-iron protein delta chain n=1 Tax=Brenneria roseae subsp. americana TaxID=1508507 RepID=A0A2U1U2C6_9GAMM|nr:Fe-only nitrogenase subunit delta [Brenneria roseae]PWC15811.1 Fe-only nitrogenase subunit delta [Brenneria roseae subsp. americana]
MSNPDEAKIDALVNYIMKNCLWQFHSRAWDREKQNAGILLKTQQLLCDEPVDLSTPADRCYWVDAVVLVDAYRSRFPWLNEMDHDAIRVLMKALHERMDYLTITGSLNAELTDQRY